jgi:hypothetical protein
MKRALGGIAAALGLALLASPLAARADETKNEAKAGLAVEMQFARELAERKPVEPGTSFTPGKVYCWNELKGGEGEYTIAHVWYRDGKQVRKQPIRAKGKKWVTWSFHKLGAGSWKVEVQDSSGQVIGSKELTVK